jgi:hypothetical protein
MRQRACAAKIRSMPMPKAEPQAIAGRSASSPARCYRNTPAISTIAPCERFSTNWPARWAAPSNKRKYISPTNRTWTLTAELQVRPHADMIGWPQRWVLGAWLIEANAAIDNPDRTCDPDVIDAPIHPRPVGVRYRTVAVGERRERGRLPLRRTASRRHQRGRGRVEGRVRVTAKAAVLSSGDPQIAGPTATPPCWPTSRPCRAGDGASAPPRRSHRAHRPRRAQGKAGKWNYGAEGRGWFLSRASLVYWPVLSWSLPAKPGQGRCCSSRRRTRATDA